MSGQFPVDPENLSPQVEWGQNVILNENNTNHNLDNGEKSQTKMVDHKRLDKIVQKNDLTVKF